MPRGPPDWFRPRTEAFVPLFPAYGPQYAERVHWDSATPVTKMIEAHISALTAANFIGASTGIKPAYVEPVYTFSGSLPPGMHYTEGYPGKGDFKGVVKFTFKTEEAWRDFRFLMPSCDSSGPTVATHLSELDFDGAFVRRIA